MKSGNVVIGILGGFAAGALLGVLFAPDKGSNTRKKIAQKSKDLKDNVKDTFNDFLTSVEDQYHHLVTKGNDVVEEGKNEFEQFKHKLNK